MTRENALPSIISLLLLLVVSIPGRPAPGEGKGERLRSYSTEGKLRDFDVRMRRQYGSDWLKQEYIYDGGVNHRPSSESSSTEIYRLLPLEFPEDRAARELEEEISRKRDRLINEIYREIAECNDLRLTNSSPQLSELMSKHSDYILGMLSGTHPPSATSTYIARIRATKAALLARLVHQKSLTPLQCILLLKLKCCEKTADLHDTWLQQQSPGISDSPRGRPSVISRDYLERYWEWARSKTGDHLAKIIEFAGSYGLDPMAFRDRIVRALRVRSKHGVILAPRFSLAFHFVIAV